MLLLADDEDDDDDDCFFFVGLRFRVKSASLASSS